jgi:hypothetical protein
LNAAPTRHIAKRDTIQEESAVNKNVVIGLLAISTLACFVFGLLQHRELQRLREVVEASPYGIASGGEGEATRQLQTQLEEQREAIGEMEIQHEAETKRLNALIEQQRQRSTLERESHADAIQKLTSKVEAAQTTQETTAADQDQSTTTATASSGFRPMMSELSKMLDDPAMNKMIQSQQKFMLDMSYGSLYGLLDLNPEDLATFKELLGRKQTEMTEIGFELMDESLTEAERDAENKTDR